MNLVIITIFKLFAVKFVIRDNAKCECNDDVTLIFKAKMNDQLHWLPVAKRIEFKSLVFVHKCFTENEPSYLTELITPYQSQRSGLRSRTDTRLLTRPKTSFVLFQ